MPKAMIRTYEETYQLPIKPYVATDINGKSVVINPKNPPKHQSENQLEQWSPVFYNLGYILSDPDDVKCSTSKNPQALKNKARGKIKIFSRKNFIQKLNIPGQSNTKDETQVVVLYEKVSKKNYTLSYSIYPK